MKPKKKGKPMPEPTQNQSVAQLLEQLLAVAKDQLQVMEETLQNVQTANTTLNALLASSKNIEKLLGGGEEVSVPAMLKVVYKFALSQGAKR
ncbi:MAG: hypothetical protein HRJ53_12170 [Acidobacteria bacterium Pan2503]|uniref:Uncharacterized protein n=1 Tax=Candidatus Acidiferrum panamense TaxID=2741543 RepID=A0A7V8NQL9_9BACT|nr:hypothetical protein [Candidatus Acidoferrum panamensis]